MRSICILQGIRLASRRVPNKVFAEVGGERLIDSGLRLLKEVAVTTGATPIVAYPENETELAESITPHGLEMLALDPDVKQTGIIHTYLAGVYLEDRFDWLFISNFICRPFLSVATAALCVQRCQDAVLPFVTAKKRRSILWDESGRCILGQGLTADTTKNPVFSELAHLGYGMPAAMVRDEDTLGILAEPFPVEMSLAETIDVDTPDDLEFARSYAVGFRYRAIEQRS